MEQYLLVPTNNLLLSISLLLTTTNYLSAPANIAPPGWRTDYINLMFMNERK